MLRHLIGLPGEGSVVDVTIAVTLNLVLLGAVIFYRKRMNLCPGALDLWSVIFYAAMFVTIFGINIFFLTDAKMTFGVETKISDATVSRVYVDYYLSWIFVFLIFGCGSKLVTLPDRSNSYSTYVRLPNSKLFDYVVLLSAIVLLAIDLALIGTPPGIIALKGDVGGAIASKGAFMNQRMDSGIPGLGYLMRYFPIFASAWLFERFMLTRKPLGFFILCFAIVVYSALTLIKSYALQPLIAACAVYFMHKGNRLNIRLVVKIFVVSCAVIFVPFYLISGVSAFELISLIVNRVFTVQIEGAILIREAFLEIRLDALLEGAPLLSRFGVATFDPAAEVISVFFPSVGEGWVNMNSHYVGQGYVMFGSLVVIVGPLVIYLNCVLLSLTSRAFAIGPNQHISSLIILSCAIYLPFNNNFGNALYLKALIAYLVLSVFLYFIYGVVKLTRTVPSNS